MISRSSLRSPQRPIEIHQGSTADTKKSSSNYSDQLKLVEVLQRPVETPRGITATNHVPQRPITSCRGYRSYQSKFAGVSQQSIENHRFITANSRSSWRHQSVQPKIVEEIIATNRNLSRNYIDQSTLVEASQRPIEIRRGITATHRSLPRSSQRPVENR